MTRFRVHVGDCVDYGATVQCRHARQASEALGAAASQLGPEALALAAVLNKRLGIPFGKTAAVLEKGFGLTVTPGGLSQGIDPVAAKCKPTYEGLVQQVQARASVTMDEKERKVGGYLWWLFVAVTAEATAYAIFPGRGYDQAAILPGEDSDGFLVRDGLAICLGFKSAYHQSCNGHLINATNRMIQEASATALPLKVIGLLQQGLAQRGRCADGQISKHGLVEATGRLEAKLERMLGRPLRLAEKRRLANHLDGEFHHLFTYLKCPGLEPTNFRAEQAIRPAEVTRKIWGGNQTSNGADTQQVLMSVLRTGDQRKAEAIPLLADLLRAPRPHVLDIVSSLPPPPN